MTEAARKQLRAALRQQRRALDPAQQKQTSEAISHRLLACRWFLQSQHIAAFIAADGEPDLTTLISTPAAQAKHWYLPAIDPDSPERLVFRRYHLGDPLVRTRLGVLEPAPEAATISPAELDLVLTPLVGFDASGNRMGMGKGFYDRSFAFKRESPDSKPWLIGIAHECQRVDSLATAWWDVPLTAVITAEHCYRADHAT